MNIISKENILREKLLNVKEGNLIIKLHKVSEELGYGNCMDQFSLEVQKFVQNLIYEREDYKLDNTYTYIMNVFYIVELYLRANIENGMNYEEFLNLVRNGKSKEIIKAANDNFVLRVHRLKKIIAKSEKKKIPKLNVIAYRDTKKFLRELDCDLSIYLKYPVLNVDMTDFWFGRNHCLCRPEMVTKLSGFLAAENLIYSLYNELCILANLDLRAINRIYLMHVRKIGINIEFNLFEKVINNYLFATIYSDTPEDLTISKVDAELLIREIKLGTIKSEELINQLIDKYNFEGFRAEYLKKYGEYLQTRIDALKESNYFGELFMVIPPE